MCGSLLQLGFLHRITRQPFVAQIAILQIHPLGKEVTSKPANINLQQKVLKLAKFRQLSP